MDSLIDGYLDSLRYERRLSDHTVRAYSIDLKAFQAWCDGQGLSFDDVNHRSVRSYLQALDQAKYKRRTINRKLSAIKTFYAYLTACGILPADPLTVVNSLKQAKRLPKTVKKSDLDNLLDSITGTTAIDLRDKAFLELLYASGARISEVAAIRLQDLDQSKRQLRLMGKGSKERIVPLHRLAVQRITDYLDMARAELVQKNKAAGLAGNRFSLPDALFLSSRGKPMSADSLRKVFSTRKRAAGLDASVTPHTIRHNFATDLIEGGADLRSVQELLGHTSLETTQIYTHLSIAHLKATHQQAHPRA
ncbi:MAG: tyrosine recombinase [Coriobacteriia bacterium]|nr:tyrosine recombinase [Coriobacteriia bacterium]